MQYRSIHRRAAWRGWLAIFGACAALLALSAPASAVEDTFCPVTFGTDTIWLGGNSGCTNGTGVYLQRIEFRNASAIKWKCAVGKAGPQQDGASSNVTVATCGYGAISDGLVATAVSGGPYGYARGTNGEASGSGGFRGRRQFF